MKERIKNTISSSIAVKNSILTNETIIDSIEEIVNVVLDCFKNNSKVLFCGNGGSAADAQHLAAEFSGRFYIDRPGLFSEALHVNTSYLTAVANDYGYEFVYSRLIDAIGKSGDVIIGLSTSGNSKNIVKAFEVAKAKNIKVIAFTGNNDSLMNELADISIQVPSTDTPRIQEVQLMMGHIICEQVERILFAK